MRLILCAAALAALAACAQPPQEETSAALIARGDYLVNNVVLCNDCHTPFTQEGHPDMTKALQGAQLPMGPLVDMPFASVAPPISGLPVGWTDEQFIHFISTGERPSGVPVLPPMPPYRLDDADARAVTAYIKTLPRAEGLPPVE
jgi:hypothetical protein